MSQSLPGKRRKKEGERKERDGMEERPEHVIGCLVQIAFELKFTEITVLQVKVGSGGGRRMERYSYSTWSGTCTL